MCDCEKSNDSSLFDQLLAKARLKNLKVDKEKVFSKKENPTIIVHAGPTNHPRDPEILERVKCSAIISQKLLLEGASAADAVELSIHYVERLRIRYRENKNLNLEEADSSLVSSDFKAGCVGAVKKCDHPISLAKHVMHNTNNVLIVGKGADKLVQELNLANANEDKECHSDKKLESNQIDCGCSGNERLDDCNESSSNNSVSNHCLEKLLPTCEIKTIGAVAFDSNGQLAAGITRFRNCSHCLSSIGTVIGCGVFANEFGCASVCGSNDQVFYTHAPARQVVKKIRDSGWSLTGLKGVLQSMEKKQKMCDISGLAIDKNGVPAVHFSAKYFPWAYFRDGKLFYGVQEGDMAVKKLKIKVKKPELCPCEIKENKDAEENDQ